MRVLAVFLVLHLGSSMAAECTGGPVHAACYMEAGSISNLTGTIDFRQKMSFGCFPSGSMEVLLDLKGFDVSDAVYRHGVQVKNYGDTSHGCTTTGYTYSADDGHGLQMLGDLGSLPENNDGSIYTLIKNQKSKLSGPFSIVGRAVVIYNGAFNPFSQNPINAPILGCCVIGFSDGARWTADRHSGFRPSADTQRSGISTGIRPSQPQHSAMIPVASSIHAHPSTSNFNQPRPAPSFHSQEHAMAPTSNFHQPQRAHSFQPQHPASSGYPAPQSDFGHDSFFGGSTISHHQPLFGFGGSSGGQANNRFNQGGSLGPHIPDFDKAQSTPIYKRKESDIRSPIFGEDPKPLFDNHHSSFFPSFDHDTSFTAEKNDVIHSKDQDDAEQNQDSQYDQEQSDNGRYASDGRQGVSQDDGQYGQQHARGEYDSGSDGSVSDTGSYDDSQASSAGAESDGYRGSNSDSDNGSSYSSSSSGSSSGSDGSYDNQNNGYANDGSENAQENNQDYQRSDDDEGEQETQAAAQQNYQAEEESDKAQENQGDEGTEQSDDSTTDAPLTAETESEQTEPTSTVDSGDEVADATTVPPSETQPLYEDRTPINVNDEQNPSDQPLPDDTPVTDIHDEHNPEEKDHAGHYVALEDQPIPDDSVVTEVPKEHTLDHAGHYADLEDRDSPAPTESTVVSPEEPSTYDQAEVTAAGEQSVTEVPTTESI